LIAATPAVTPVTMPEAEPTEATEGSLLLHVPPGVASNNDMAAPWHTDVAPLIVATVGIGFTFSICVTKAVPQLFVMVYVIVVVPIVLPETTPEDGPTDAIADWHWSMYPLERHLQA